jgi:dipeptidase E
LAGKNNPVRLAAQPISEKEEPQVSMKYYLSSFSFGNEVERLKTLLLPGSRIGHIINAQDQTDVIPDVRPPLQISELEALNSLGFKPEVLDLRAYFGKPGALEQKLDALDGLWISGGNTFVLRLAMKMSGLDALFTGLRRRKNFLYAGYSAAICVLCDSLKYIQNVDDPSYFPYAQSQGVIWEGLGVFDYGWLPHYRSDHYESAAIEKDVQVCIDNKWLFKVLSDGEVIVFEE